MMALTKPVWKQRLLFFGGGIVFLPFWFLFGFILCGWENPTFTFLPIAICVLVLCLRVFRGESYRAGSFIVGMATPLILVIFFFFFYISTLDPTVDHAEFDAAKWRNSPAATSSATVPLRLRMANDLINSNRLDYMNMKEVKEILGTPDWEMPLEYLGNETWMYWLDWQPGVFGNSKLLEVQFDENGLTKKVHQVRD